MACKKQETCPIEDDLFPIYLKLKEAQGIILASPVYFGSATALIKALMEMVSDSRVLYPRFYVLECGFRQRKGRSGTG
jgi:multimeric flavodoxin WrbA